jgi:HAD superfamily hydrolase (TIGR01509 family)
VIKAVAFDLVGVLLRENNFVLDPVEAKLEKKFGVINTDAEFYAWAQTEMGSPRDVLEQKVKHIIDNIYDLREPNLFDKLPKLKFSLATNSLSYHIKWFRTLPIAKNFQFLVNSAEFKTQKPEKKFYEILINLLAEKPENILFVDDIEDNCLGAKMAGLQTLHFLGNNSLSKEILRVLS